MTIIANLKKLYKIYLKFNNEGSPYIQTLKNYLETNKLIIKEFDKNMGLTIIPLDWYKNQDLIHLTDKKFL
ncbi:MAG: hypothetical protein ACRCZ9_00685 [Fusobacteriaceae bacterium]